MGIQQEGCFVPSYIDSNMSDEEFIALAESCLPKAFAARIVEATDNQEESVTEEVSGKIAGVIEDIRKSIPDASIENVGDETPVGDAVKTINAQKAAFESIAAHVNKLEEIMEAA